MIAVFTVVFFAILGFFQVNSALASVPREINYQSRLRSSTLAPITVPTDIQFSIYSSQTLGAYTDTASSSGPLLWKGVYDGGACPQITPDADGYFAVQLGSACAVFPSYIDWNQTLFLGVRIGADAEANPRVQLSAFPYALNAEAVDTFSASSTAAANTLLALDQNLNFNILTGGFLGAYFTMSSSTVTSTIAGNFDVQGNTTLGSSSADLISVNGRFNTDLVPALDLAYSLGSAANRWNGEFGTVTTTNLNVLGAANFTDITWVNATGTNTTSTNLFATNVGATYINFDSATGVSLNLSNTLYINTIAINATGTTSTNSGAWLIGVFDEFTFSNATNIQDVLDDLDLAISNVSTTEVDTLQTVTNRGNSTTNTIQFAGGTSTGVLNITGAGTSTVSDNFQILGHMTVGNSGIIDGGSVFASTPGSVVLNVEEEFTSPLADYTRGVASFLRLNSGEASTPASVSAYESSVETAGATNFTSEISGVRGQVSHIGTGLLQTSYGSIGISAIGGTGTIGSSIGVFGQSYSFGAGNVTSAYALYGETFNNGAGATITNNYGLFLANQAGVGVNNYNLYSAGSNSLNVMEGSLGIGVTTATSRLQVNSGASTIVPIFTLQNTNGDIQMFNATGSPEGFVSGSIGDLAVDLVGGRFYIKETGTATVTGWAPFATGTGSGTEVDTLQTVTARGNTTTLPIYVQNTSTFRDIVPETHNLYSLGTTTTRWKELYAVTTYVGSSTWALEQASNAGFSLRNTANLNDSIRVNPNGDVGIGTSDQTTVPLARLHVLGGSVLMGGNSGEEIFLLDPVANTVSIGDYIGWNSNTFIRVDDNAARIIMPNGFVGIGTSTPATKLDLLASSASTTPIMTIGNTAGDYQLFTIQADPNGSITGSRGDLAVDSTSGRLYIKESGTNTNTGWVGVATGTSVAFPTLDLAYDGASGAGSGRAISLDSGPVQLNVSGVVSGGLDYYPAIQIQSPTDTAGGFSVGTFDFGFSSGTVAVFGNDLTNWSTTYTGYLSHTKETNDLSSVY
ncbi:hypothetical protein IPH19_01700 [Candidatus Uhrbacteria bacterium]|nr:MAG: hypothetical protein IPH19_01700 [Candidatus Uhrbacteria bacterium]